jgi:hypothetical protein
MKAHERRATLAYPYFKLLTWDVISFTWRAGKRTVSTEAEARRMAVKRGRYCVERFDDGPSRPLEAFEV